MNSLFPGIVNFTIAEGMKVITREVTGKTDVKTELVVASLVSGGVALSMSGMSRVSALIGGVVSIGKDLVLMYLENGLNAAIQITGEITEISLPKIDTTGKWTISVNYKNDDGSSGTVEIALEKENMLFVKIDGKYFLTSYIGSVATNVEFSLENLKKILQFLNKNTTGFSVTIETGTVTDKAYVDLKSFSDSNSIKLNPTLTRS